MPDLNTTAISIWEGRASGTQPNESPSGWDLPAAIAIDESWDTEDVLRMHRAHWNSDQVLETLAYTADGKRYLLVRAENQGPYQGKLEIGGSEVRRVVYLKEEAKKEREKGSFSVRDAVVVASLVTPVTLVIATSLLRERPEKAGSQRTSQVALAEPVQTYQRWVREGGFAPRPRSSARGSKGKICTSAEGLDCGGNFSSLRVRR